MQHAQSALYARLIESENALPVFEEPLGLCPALFLLLCTDRHRAVLALAYLYPVLSLDRRHIQQVPMLNPTLAPRTQRMTVSSQRRMYNHYRRVTPPPDAPHIREHWIGNNIYNLVKQKKNYGANE